MTNLGDIPAPVDDAQAQLRHVAVDRLRKQREFQAHLTAYILVNLLLKPMTSTAR